MKTEVWIKGVRNYLNDPILDYLHFESEKTEDIEVLKKLLTSAKSLMGTYIDDADFYLRRVPK